MEVLKLLHIACMLISLTTSLYLPACSRGHDKPCRSADILPAAELKEEKGLAISDEILSGAKLTARREDEKLVKRSDSNLDPPASRRPPGAKYTVVTDAEAATVLSKSEMSRYRRLKMLYNERRKVERKIEKYMKNGMQPEQELINLSQRLKPLGNAYYRLRNEAMRRFIRASKAPAPMVNRYENMKQNLRDQRYTSMTPAQRIETIAKRRARRQAGRNIMDNLQARADAGESLLRTEVDKMNRLRTQFQRQVERARSRWNMIPVKERKARLAAHHVETTEAHEILSERWEKLRAKVQARTASAAEHAEFQQLGRELRVEVQSSKPKDTEKKPAKADEPNKGKKDPKTPSSDTAAQESDPTDAEEDETTEPRNAEGGDDTTESKNPETRFQAEPRQQRPSAAAAEALKLDPSPLAPAKDNPWTRIGATVDAVARGSAASLAGMLGKVVQGSDAVSPF